MVWVVSRFRLKAPPGISSSYISPLTSSGQRSRASWASHPQKSATLSPQPGGKPRKFIRTCGGIGGKNKSWKVGTSKSWRQDNINIDIWTVRIQKKVVDASEFFPVTDIVCYRCWNFGLDATDIFSLKLFPHLDMADFFEPGMNLQYFKSIYWSALIRRGIAVAQWLRFCATNRKVAGSIPAGVIGSFHWHKILPIVPWPWGQLSL